MKKRNGILVVDDSVESLRLIVDNLVSEGFTVRPVTNGEQALQAVRAEPPELILLDVRMPGIDGFEVCRTLQSQESTRSIPVLFLSGLSDGNERANGLKLGAMDFITKPVQKEELLARVRTHLELSRLRGDLEDRVQERTQELHDKHDELLATEEMLRTQIKDYETSQEMLQESEEHYRAIIDAFDGQIYICSQNYQILFQNERMRERIGRNAVGEPCFKALHDLDDVCSWCVNERVFRGETVRWELQSPKDNRWYYVVNTPIYNQDGTISKQALITDITNRKVSELALQESEGRFRSIVEHFPSMVMIHVDDKFVYLNPSAVEAFGISDQQEYLGKQIMEVVHPNFHNVVRERVERAAINNGVNQINEEQLLRKDGSPFWAEITGFPYTHQGKKAVLVIGANITERKLAEKVNARFLLAQRAILDNLPMMAWLKDTESRLEMINEPYAKACGHTVDECIGKTDLELFPLEMAKGFMADDREICLSGKKKQLEESITTPDGIRFHLTYKTPVFDENGLVIGTTGIAQDITERKQAEEERRKLEHQFHQAQKMESLGVLAGGIGHDFNNILTVILGHCYMAKSDYIPEAKFKEAFLKIETAGNRAADLCRQMLTFAGESPMEQTRVDLWLLVDEVVKMLQAAIKKNVTIELDLKRDVPEIDGDTAQIQQIIMNLLINAADAIGEANGTIGVKLSKSVFETDHSAKDAFGTFIKSGRYACLEVADTGSGMDEATMKRIFEPFFTTKSTGRGLGMSAVQGIVKSHEGNLQLTSTPGVGTAFKIFFPLPNKSGNAETSLNPVSLTEKTSGTILLVEDEETLRVMGKTVLDAMGFSAMTASNGSEALEIYRERGSEIKLILMDLIMPVMGGIEAYHELRKINPTVPIIICSGYGVESVKDVIGNDPHAGFVHKPYKPEQLRDAAVKMIG